MSDDVLRVPFGEVARLKEEKKPRQKKPKIRHKNTDGKTRPKEASMSQSNVPETMMNKQSTSEQEKALAKPSAFSESWDRHSGEFATAFSLAAGAVAGGLFVVGVAALVQKGVNAAFGGSDTDEASIEST